MRALVLTALLGLIGCADHGADECRTSDECGLAAICFPPGELFYCQPAPRSTCTADGDCGAGMICERNSCAGGNPSCFGACTQDSDCGEGHVCNATGHCAVLPCGTGCPARFQCDSSGSCQRTACQSDGECPSGSRCVDEHCYSGFGRCGLID